MRTLLKLLAILALGGLLGAIIPVALIATTGLTEHQASVIVPALAVLSIIIVAFLSRRKAA